MRKAKALELLGGTQSTAAGVIGISYQAVDKWPDPLPPRIADRVIAAWARLHYPELVGEVEGKAGAATPAVQSG